MTGNTTDPLSDQSRHYTGHAVDDVPSEYDGEEVRRALRLSPPKNVPRIAWSTFAEKDPSRDDGRPNLPGTANLSAATDAGRCGCPLPNSRERFDELRYCTGMPLRRFGKAAWHTGSDFCKHHAHLEKRAQPGQEIFEYLTDEPLPYNTRFD